MKKDYWIIRHIPSGNIIPQATGFIGRGGTHVEPLNPSLSHPKLFKSSRSAKGWLTIWLKGKQIRHSYQSFDGEYNETVETTPVPSRKRDEMEIVLATLRIR